MFSLLSLILIHVLTSEAPSFETDIKWEHFKNGLNNQLEVDQEVITNSKELLIDQEVDLSILATIQLFETRLKPDPKDGDCHWQYNPGKKSKLVCRSFGPMQISGGVVKWAKNILPDDLKNMKPEELHDPTINTRVGIIVLNNFKAICKSSLPGVWLTAYGEGHCPKNNQLDSEGIRRCAVLTSLLKANNSLPDNWKCGHEGKIIKDKTALKFIKKIEEYSNQKVAVEDPEK